MKASALHIWRKKLEHLQRAEAISSDAAQQFTLQNLIAEAQAKIAVLAAAETRVTPPPLAHKENLPNDAFVCYSHEDIEFVFDLVSRLRENSISTWYDQAEIQTGVPILEQYREGISKSNFLIICVSANFQESLWQQSDYRTLLFQKFEANNSKVVLALISDCAEDDMPDFLFSKYFLDIRTREGFYELLSYLQSPSETVGHAENDRPTHSTLIEESIKENIKTTILGAQLLFPYPLAQSLFNIFSSLDDSSFLNKIEDFIGKMSRTFLAMLLSEYFIGQTSLDPSRLLRRTLSRGSLPQTVDLIFKVAEILSQRPKSEIFLDNLIDWAISPSGKPSVELLSLVSFQSDLKKSESYSLNRTMKSLRDLLRSLDWLKNYRIGYLDSLTVENSLTFGKMEFLSGTMSEFIPFECSLVACGNRLPTKGCYIVDVGRGTMLPVMPFFYHAREIMHLLKKKDRGEILLVVAGADGSNNLVFCNQFGSPNIEIPGASELLREIDHESVAGAIIFFRTNGSDLRQSSADKEIATDQACRGDRRAAGAHSDNSTQQKYSGKRSCQLG